MKEWFRRLTLAATLFPAVALTDAYSPSSAYASKLEQPVSHEVENHKNVTFFMYHEVSPGLIKSLIYEMKASGVEPISLETIAKAQRGEVEIPQSRRYYHITLDDGLKSQLSALKDIQEYFDETGIYIPLTFFVIPKFEDLDLPTQEIPDNTPSYNDRVHRYLNKGELVQLIKAGCIIADHTANHANLGVTSFENYVADIERGEQRIADLYALAGKKRDVKPFAFPYGLFSTKVLEYLKSRGYDVAFSTGSTSSETSLRHLTVARVGRT